MLRKFRQTFSNSKGTASLEALFSLVLLFVCLYVVWGVALVIFNQSKLNTATQLSAQAGLITLNRTAYTGPPSGNAGLIPLLSARWSSEMIFKENMCGTMAGMGREAPGKAACDSLSGIGHSGPPSSNFSFAVGCSESVTSANSSFNQANCNNPNFRAVRFHVRGSMISPFPFAGGGNLNAGSTTGSKHLNSTSSVYSYTK